MSNKDFNETSYYSNSITLLLSNLWIFVHFYISSFIFIILIITDKSKQKLTS